MVKLGIPMKAITSNSGRIVESHDVTETLSAKKTEDIAIWSDGVE